MIGILKKVLSICQSLSKGNPTRTSGNSMNLLEAPNKDLGAASPTLQNPRLNTSVTQAFVNSILYCKHSPAGHSLERLIKRF